MHQLAQLNGAAEKTRRGHDERKHHGGLPKAHGEPGQPFLCPDELQVVAQHLAKAAAQLAFFDRFAAVQRNRLAVLPHPHQVVPKVGLHPLLSKVQANQRAANVVRDDAAKHAVHHRHPHHEAGNHNLVAVEAEGKTARERPQNTHKADQRDHRVEQAHGQTHRVAGEEVHVLGDALVRVVGRLVAVAGEARQLQVVESLVGQPAVDVMHRHPGAPAHFQQLRQIEAVDRDHDEAKRQVGEAPQLAPEHRRVLVLQRVVKHAVPLVEQHQHVHRRQVQRHDGREQGARTPLFFRIEVGRSQRTDLAGKQAEALEFGQGLGHRRCLNRS